MASWGEQRGNTLGYQIFITLIKTAGVFPAYALLRVVTLYYLIFPGKASKPLMYYFQKRLGYNYIKAKFSVYRNFNYLGRSIIDKMVMMSPMPNPFEVDHVGMKSLDDMAAAGKGGLLVSAHIGNWEGAGHLLKRLKTKINIVMHAVEHEKIKLYLDSVRERSFNVILISDNMSHVYEINEAIKRNEFVCIHADRYLEGNKTIKATLLDKEATFPIGPFILATTFEAPVSFVFAMKDGVKSFKFYATPAKIYPKGRQGIAPMLEDYMRKIEVMIKLYPLQWHNYFPFWDEEKENPL